MSVKMEGDHVVEADAMPRQPDFTIGVIDEEVGQIQARNSRGVE
jgi:hypothetical protein